ncbi:MAG: endonuclease Q family protein, partial [Candidatus Staskawiczbacteria bacterium]
MKLIADFHIHSKYSRAVSPLMNLKNLSKWAEIKGINVLGTGDFTHPKWLRSIKKELVPAERGLFRLKKIKSPTRFILTSEISCIYSKGGKVRKIHIIVFAPSIEVVEKINYNLSKIGNLKADGRPILGLDAEELVKIILEVDKNCLIVPAHAWTPWFSIFGSKSGFNSLEECFGK